MRCGATTLCSTNWRAATPVSSVGRLVVQREGGACLLLLLFSRLCQCIDIHLRHGRDAVPVDADASPDKALLAVHWITLVFWQYCRACACSGLVLGPGRGAVSCGSRTAADGPAVARAVARDSYGPVDSVVAKIEAQQCQARFEHGVMWQNQDPALLEQAHQQHSLLRPPDS